ncbi:hypothetical protein SPRI_3148 [Streptomyces pristinaespiralis]|uniref:Uncharacterized protein n=1 Tax=Streptomyces pristinaespiralis TaxID=38300 RepID=A0A0M4D5E8_STRPR|nr:hypothetical protein SPRI_3148 [Streptomyces pristinaespiralis]
MPGHLGPGGPAGPPLVRAALRGPVRCPPGPVAGPGVVGHASCLAFDTAVVLRPGARPGWPQFGLGFGVAGPRLGPGGPAWWRHSARRGVARGRWPGLAWWATHPARRSTRRSYSGPAPGLAGRNSGLASASQGRAWARAARRGGGTRRGEVSPGRWPGLAWWATHPARRSTRRSYSDPAPGVAGRDSGLASASQGRTWARAALGATGPGRRPGAGGPAWCRHSARCGPAGPLAVGRLCAARRGGPGPGARTRRPVSRPGGTAWRA